MNNVMMILSVAAIAGTASAQYATGGKSEVGQQLHEHLSKVQVRQMQFAGVEDGKVTIPLRIADDNSTNMQINADEVEISVTQEGSLVIVEIDGVEVFNGELDSDFQTFTLTSGENEIELVNAGDGEGNVFIFENGRFEGARHALELAQGLHGKALMNVQEFGGHPKVMMGVTLEGVGEATAKQLGIDADGATMIGTVMDGLPAGKAGLEQYDIVVGVDGLDGASPKQIREALGDKEAGDQLVLDVVREGRAVQVVLNLEAYDAASLGVKIEHSFAFAPRVMDPEHAEEQFGEWLQELVDQRAELREGLQGALDQGTRDELIAKMEGLNGHIEKMRQQIAKGDFTMPNNMSFPQGAWAWSGDDMSFTLDLDLENMPNVEFFRQGDGHAVVVPDAHGSGEIKVLIERLERSAEEHERSVEHMESRIQDLERMLERAVQELHEAKQDKGPDA